MNETDVLNIPTWMKYLASAAGFVGAGALFLRQYLSQAKVDRTANDANAATIERLQAALIEERNRADSLMREREAMVRELGELKGKVEALTQQVELLRDVIQGQRGLQA